MFVSDVIMGLILSFSLAFHLTPDSGLFLFLSLIIAFDPLHDRNNKLTLPPVILSDYPD